MAFDASGTATATAMPHLTRSSCLGCHSINVTSIIGPKVDADYDSTATDGTGRRAGGTFKYDSEGVKGPADDNSVHNVYSADVPIPATLTEDETFDNAALIPGLEQNTGMNANKGSADPNDLTCAGSSGCHGDATLDGNDAGIRGFHHSSKEGYRFLQIASNKNAVSGIGSTDWEEGGADATNHNVYSSDPPVGISKLCGNCHPDFHGLTQSGGNWIRHPTDETLPSEWSPNLGTPDLYEEHPFAFVDLTGKSTTYEYASDVENAQVMCLSCHRAHGTPYGDLLRWDYDSQDAGSGHDEGCLGCHSAQR